MRETARLWLQWRLAATVAIMGMASLLLPAAAAAEGGSSIATAPSIVYGQQEFGNTATSQYLEGSCGTGLLGGGDGWRSYWSLSVAAGDLVTVNWEGTAGTELKLMPVGTTDYTLFQTEPVVSQELSSNLKNQDQYTVPVSGVMPLYFRVCESNGKPGPYSFTVTAQHGVSVNLLPRPHIRTTSVVYGSAALVSGAPVPDGMSFTLTASWSNGSTSYTAASSGGSLAFTLALPEELEGQTITLALNRAADAEYQAPKPAEIQTQVARPRVEPAPVKHRHRHRRHRHHRHHHHLHHR